MRVTLADSSYVDYSTAVPLYLKLCGNLQSYSSGVSKMVHVGCCVLCHVLPNLTSDVVLGMDWLHAINPRIDWNALFAISRLVEVILYVFWVLK